LKTLLRFVGPALVAPLKAPAVKQQQILCFTVKLFVKRTMSAPIFSLHIHHAKWWLLVFFTFLSLRISGVSSASPFQLDAAMRAASEPGMFGCLCSGTLRQLTKPVCSIYVVFDECNFTG
jgi:hypothetical protein